MNFPMHDRKKGNFDQNWLEIDPRKKKLKKFCMESEKMCHESNKIQIFTVFSWNIFEIGMIFEFAWVPIIDQKQKMKWNP